MKCEHCGMEIVKIDTSFEPAVCNAPPVLYWLSGYPNTRILTPNGQNVYCVLKGDPEKAHGIGYTPHTCFEEPHEEFSGIPAAQAINKGFPSKDVVERVRGMYPPGCRVELVSMEDPYTALLPGERGWVEFVDDTGTVFVAWDSGSHLGAVYGVDVIKLCDRSMVNDFSNRG